MESWRHTSEGNNHFSCEIGLPAEVLGESRKFSMGWNMKSSCNSHKLLGSRSEATENMELIEMGFPNMVGKSGPSNPSVDDLGGGIGNCFSRKLPSTCDITSNSSFGEMESGLSFSSPFIVSNGKKSSLIDMKLGKLADWREAKSSGFSNDLSSAGSSLTSKRMRTSTLYSQNPVCIVQGCHKDLTSAKDYHKRHKVCDVHSRTPRVIVNGIEQRFCQQCSRFHLLAEFDDGKRSCRKRLAGHNERRRKPQLDTALCGQPLKLLQFYEGTRFLRTSLPKRLSFVFPDMLPGGLKLFSPQGNQLSHIKVEEGSRSKPVFHLRGTEKQFSRKNLSPCTDDYTFLETASKVKELSGVSHSGSALSLLSAQSKNLSSPLTETPFVFDQNCENHVGLSIEKRFSPNGYCSSWMNSIDQIVPQVVFDGSAGTDFEVQEAGFFQRSDCVKSKGYVSAQHGPTIDLVQLSSHLQRVEQQRNYMQVKQENGAFCSFPTMHGL